MQVYQYTAAAAPGAGQYTTNSTFNALQFRADVAAPVQYSFLTGPPGPIVPHTQVLPAPAHVPPLPRPDLRVSQQGNLAVEHADLTRRQPRHFFANQGRIFGWNRTLTRLGSEFQLIPDPASTVTFVPPAGGPARTLVKVFPANLSNGTAGDQMSMTENCDTAVMNVTGGGGVFGATMNAVFNQPVYLGVGAGQSLFAEYFAAIALTGGHPLNTDLPTAPVAALQTLQNQIAQRYGQAVWAMRNAIAPIPFNPNLGAALQNLGLNQHARPWRVGQGLYSASLGNRVPAPGGFTVQDHANNRPLNAANINHVLWGFHWGGVVAIDGTDYLTLENYARGAEISPAAAALIGAPPAQEDLYYVQLYGAGVGQSWHEQWETPGAQGKGFANGITMLVEPSVQSGMRYFVAGSKNGQAAVAPGGGLLPLQRALLNGLNYANMHLHAPGLTDRIANKARVLAWRAALNNLLAAPLPAAVAGPQTQALADHVLANLNAVTANLV